MKQEVILVPLPQPGPNKVIPAIIGKRPTNTRSNLLESVIRRPKESDDEKEEEEFDLMKQARHAINQRNANDRVTTA